MVNDVERDVVPGIYGQPASRPICSDFVDHASREIV